METLHIFVQKTHYTCFLPFADLISFCFNCSMICRICAKHHPFKRLHYDWTLNYGNGTIIPTNINPNLKLAKKKRVYLVNLKNLPQTNCCHIISITQDCGEVGEGRKNSQMGMEKLPPQM